MSKAVDDERRRAPRKEIASKVEFVVDSGHVMEAHGLDVSEHGVGFESTEPLQVALTVTVDGEEQTRIAHLVRVVADEDGRYIFGLEFVKKLES